MCVEVENHVSGEPMTLNALCNNNKRIKKRSKTLYNGDLHNFREDTQVRRNEGWNPHDAASSAYPKKVGILDKKTSVIKMGFPETVKLDRLAHNSFT